MREELRSLIELQRIDTDVQRMSLRKRELPERIARMEANWADFERDANDRRERYSALTKRHREREEQLQRGLDGLRRAKDRLLEVKTNREYQAILKEIETQEEKNGELEDQILQLLEEMDAGRGAVAAGDRELETRRRDYETERGNLEKELAALDEELARIQRMGQDLRGRLDPNLLKKYEHIKGLNRGLAVVFAWREVCGGCHMNLPPQFYNELMKTEDMFSCPHCSRILFWENREENGR